MTATPLEPPPADLELVRRLAAVTLALGEAEDRASRQAEAGTGPEGWRRAVSYVLGAVSLLIDRHSGTPALDLARAAERLAAMARGMARASAPWPPRLGQKVWLIGQDTPGRIQARDGAGLSFKVLPDGPGQYPVRLILRELTPLAELPNLPAAFAGATTEAEPPAC